MSERNWYVPRLYLWRVALGDDLADGRRAEAFIAAPDSKSAADEALETMLEAWKNEARFLRVFSVTAVHPVHSIARAAPAPTSGEEAPVSAESDASGKRRGGGR